MGAGGINRKLQQFVQNAAPGLEFNNDRIKMDPLLMLHILYKKSNIICPSSRCRDEFIQIRTPVCFLCHLRSQAGEKALQEAVDVGERISGACW